MITVLNGTPSLEVDEAVFFPFDDHSIPVSYGLKLGLVPGKPPFSKPAVPGRMNPIVLDRSNNPDAPDSGLVHFYGTVIYVEGEFRMWYLGVPQDEGKVDWEKNFVCYAVSKDGINWEKPNLGLVEYRGSAQNNIVDTPKTVGPPLILYEPEDPDPQRRFKMAFQSAKYDGCLSVAFSPDGLRWKEYSNNPVGRFLEPSGIMKFNGCYYVNGQEGGWPEPGPGHYIPGRTMVTYVSYDFEHWSEGTSLSFIRHNQRALLGRPSYSWNAGEQVHLGASLWNRGNVIIGFYGQWHGHDNEDRQFVNIDIGLIVSNDGIHFREPIPDFRIIPAYEELGMTENYMTHCRALAQGQAFANVGDKTFVWYGDWRERGGVRLAAWDRDRLGYFEVIPTTVKLPLSDRRRRGAKPHFATCPLKINRPNCRIFLNAEGLSEHSYLTVEICDYKFQKLVEYSGEHCVPIKENGLRIPAKWRNRETIENFKFPIRIRVNFEGLRPEDARVYAVYVTCQE